MDDVFTIIFAVGLIIATILIGSFLGALLIFWIWPLVIPVIFPGLVASGIIAGKLSFWVAFGLSILCSVLFKSYNNNNKKE